MTELFRPTALAIQKLLNQFDPANRFEDAKVIDGPLAPIFVVGPPRSGSTLLYQALCRCLEVSYISNIMSLLPRFIVRLARFSLRHAPARDAAFARGDYGFLPGLFAPSEAGKIMDKWFTDGGDDEFRRAVRRSLAGIGRRTGYPLLVKCPSLVLKLDAIVRTVPQARFIVLTREPVFVVQSLLLGRGNRELSADRWEGIEPPGSEAYRNAGPEAEVSWQVAEIVRIIDQTVGDVPPGRVAHVTYEGFCSDPRGTVRRISAELEVPCNLEGLPARFEISDSRRVSEDSWRKIVAASGVPAANEVPAGSDLSSHQIERSDEKHDDAKRGQV